MQQILGKEFMGGGEQQTILEWGHERDRDREAERMNKVEREQEREGEIERSGVPAAFYVPYLMVAGDEISCFH